MRVLVTGGTGTISSGIVEESVQRKYETYALTRGKRSYRNIKGANYITVDIWDEAAVQSELQNERFDVVVECLVYDVEQLKISLNNFANICDQYIFISTTAVYSETNGRRIKENDEKHCMEWWYSRQKIECETYLIQYCKNTGLKYTIIRPPVTYGNYRVPFPVATRNPAWTFFQRIRDQKPMLTCENVKFSVIHIKDFSYAVVSLFGNERAFNEDFHITAEEEICWDSVIHEAAKILNVEPLIIHLPAEEYSSLWKERYDEMKWNKSVPLSLDGTKIKEAVPAFKSTILVNSGVKNIMEAMRRECMEQQLPLSTSWNTKCDEVIYMAYKKRIVSDKEMEMLTKYYDSLSKL